MQNADRLFGHDIVIVGQQPWDTTIGSNCKNIALEWSKYNRVLYVNTALDRISAYTQKNDLKIKRRLAVIRGEQKGLVTRNGDSFELTPEGQTISGIVDKAFFKED